MSKIPVSLKGHYSNNQRIRQYNTPLASLDIWVCPLTTCPSYRNQQREGILFDVQFSEAARSPERVFTPEIEAQVPYPLDGR